MLTKFLVFGALGLSMEVFWTGLASLLQKDFRLTSSTSIWMFFIYGSASFFGPLYNLISPMPVIVRGMIYVFCIFAAEFTVGLMMKNFGICPWDYGGARYSIMGIIRLDYAPVWFAAGMIFEYVNRFFLSRL